MKHQLIAHVPTHGPHLRHRLRQRQGVVQHHDRRGGGGGRGRGQDEAQLEVARPREGEPPGQQALEGGHLFKGDCFKCQMCSRSR